MEIQSALEGELTINSEFSCDLDESGKTGDKFTTFKRPLSCYNCGSPQKANWTAMRDFTLVRKHSAAQNVKRSSPHQGL